VSISEVINLYIPHGSDESTAVDDPILHELNLYIPHGSDERVEKLKLEASRLPLYPTWFR